MSESPTPEQLLADAAWLRRLAVTLAGNELDADDLVQESRIAAWARQPDADRSLRPWLAKVVRDVAGMRRRSDQRRAAREHVVGSATAEASSPDALLDQMRLHRLLVDLVLELEEPFRSTIIARFVEGKTSAAIAKALDVPAATVRWRLREGLARLRLRLDAERGDRKSWAPAVLAFSRGGAHVARSKPTIAILLLLLALLGGAAVVVVRAQRSDSREETALGISGAGSNGGIGSDRRASTDSASFPAWFGQPGVAAKRIAGHVTFDGAPVAGAIVSLDPFPLGTTGLPSPTRRTGDDGSFDFGLLPAGLYNVGAHAADRTAAILRLAVDDPTLKPPADQLELRLAACTGSVIGKIVDAAGSPIPHAHVRRESVIGVEADARGDYRICTPPGDAIELTFGADGYGTVALAIDVLGEAHRDVVLVPEATLPVRTVGGDGKPVAAALVSVHPAQYAPDRPFDARTITDEDGQGQVVGLVPGAYTLWASDGHASIAHEIALMIVAGPNPAATLTLENRSRVRGRVVSSQGPIAGAKVSAVRMSPKARSNTVHSQADGSFVLDGVMLGDLSFIAAPYRVVSPTTFRVSEPKDYDVVIEVAQRATVAGVVTRHGQPVAGVEVCCVHDGLGLSKARTDASGRYEYRGVSPGTYRLTAQTLEAFVKPIEVTVTDREPRTVDLELDLAASISGSVVDQDGKPVASALVVWQYSGADDTGRCNTDRAGRYRCAAMTGGGRYVASVFPDAPKQRPFSPAAAPFPSIDLKDGAASADNVTLAVRYEQLPIAGVVVDETGSPLADARVEAQPMQGDSAPAFSSWLRLSTTFTDGSGAFTLNGLVAGSYALHAHAVDGADAIIAGVVAGATGLKLQVLRPAAIQGTLAGFVAAPLVWARPIDTLTGDSNAVSGIVDGNTFRITGLRAGRYLVDAQSQAEGDVRMVELHSGEVARITLTARGSGSIEGTVLDFRTQKPLAGAICQSFLSSGNQIGTTNWDVPAAPRSGPAGKVILDPAPVGDVVVACIMPSERWSRPAVHVTVRPRERAIVRLYSVESRTDAPGTLGLVFDGTVSSPRIAAIVPGNAGAKAGLLVGDVVVAVNGLSVEELDGDGVWRLIDDAPIGTDVAVTVMRGIAKRTFSAKLEPRP